MCVILFVLISHFAYLVSKYENIIHNIKNNKVASIWIFQTILILSNEVMIENFQYDIGICTCSNSGYFSCI